MTIIINWFGPHKEEELKRIHQNTTRFYLITGRRDEAEPAHMYYTGRCDVETLLRRATTVFDKRYWHAEVTYPSAVEMTAEDVNQVLETALVRTWEAHFTEKRDRVYPNAPTSIVVGWYKPDRYPARIKPARLSKLPSFLFWNNDGWEMGKML